MDVCACISHELGFVNKSKKYFCLSCNPEWDPNKDGQSHNISVFVSGIVHVRVCACVC